MPSEDVNAFNGPTREIPCGACGTAIVVPDDIADDAEDGDYVICGLCALKDGDLKNGFVQ